MSARSSFRLHLALVTAAIAAGLALPRASSAADCAITKTLRAPLALGSLWQQALDDLAAATAESGRPWSCAGGRVELTQQGAGAILVVTDGRGERAARFVASPDEVVPTAEALLATPLVLPAPPVAHSPLDEPPPLLPPSSGVPRDPRALFLLMIGPRASGPGAMAWLSARGEADLPFGPWAIGFWARYDIHLAGPAGSWNAFRCSAFSVGVAGIRQIVTHPFVLEATLEPSLAVVFMEAGQEQPGDPQGDKALFRVGSTLRATFPVKGIFRGVVGLDGELAPSTFAGIRNIDTTHTPPQLPAVPAYTFGLVLGAEAPLQ